MKNGTINWVSCGLWGGPEQRQAGAQRAHGLPEILPAGRQAARVFLDHLAPVVYPAHGAEHHQHAQGDPHETVAQIRPQQGGDGDRDQNQPAAHGGRAGFAQVALGAVVADRLTDLFFLQLADHDRADPERQEQCRQHRQNGAQGNVLNHQESGIKLTQQFRQPKQHQCPLPLSVSRCTTCSMRALRDPLTNTVPPWASVPAARSAA